MHAVLELLDLGPQMELLGVLDGQLVRPKVSLISASSAVLGWNTPSQTKESGPRWAAASASDMVSTRCRRPCR
ncbi:MAG TPA: hypothetical protein VII33_06770 [Nakamurella sp.]